MAHPAQALEEVVVELPLLQSRFALKISELQRPEALLEGNSDLAELNRASGGELGRGLMRLFHQPLPFDITPVTEAAVGSPLLEQALLLLSSLGRVEGLETDLSGERLRQALLEAQAADPQSNLSLWQLLRALPGDRVIFNPSKAHFAISRLIRQRSEAEALFAAASVAANAPPQSLQPVRVSQHQLAVKHRSAPLALTVVQPITAGEQLLVLISHGLWDSPLNFLGWAQALASEGYTVVLPSHPGSDSHQQHQVLSGQAPPPEAAELGLRALDLSAINDAVANNRLAGLQGLATDRIVVIGHSWGATTALQLAGVRPQPELLRERCGDVEDPSRNLSWALQCSWLQGVHQASFSDPRVVAVVAVSPPMSLLFPRGSAAALRSRVLLVSGTDDWVVPPDPEAIAPFRSSAQRANSLVLVKGGDHFNLRPGSSKDGGVLAPLLVKWSDAAFAAAAAGETHNGSEPLVLDGAWGSSQIPMADVTSQVRANQ